LLPLQEADMPEEKNENTLPVEDLPEQDATEPAETDEFLDEAPVVPRETRPGPRHRFPPVPEADTEALDEDLPPTTVIDPGFNPTAAAATGIRVIRNSVLSAAASNNSTSVVHEPSVASNGDVVFYTANWLAALSTDGGANFRFVNPFTSFPDPPDMGFCCDQVVQYIPSIDMFAWLLQYTENSEGENVLRLAFGRTADIRNRRWRTFDIKPRQLGSPNNMIDFPDLAVGQNMLYITTNAFLGEDWTASYVIRIRLSQLVSGRIRAQRAVSRDNFAFRMAQNCGARALWASHNTTASLRVFSWDENQAQPSATDVSVPQWSRSGMSSRSPDGFDWLGRCDSRILGAALAGNELWFTWGAGRGQGRPHPHTRIARLNASTLALQQSQALAAASYAIQYATLGVNSGDEVGAAFCFGGGSFFPSHAVGILSGTPAFAKTADGKHGPARQQWGDYLAVRRHHPDGRIFSATGYSLETGTSDLGVAPRFVMFGR
jgi:hypothetical protein